MSQQHDVAPTNVNCRGNMLALAFLSLLVGVASGLLGAVFLLSLKWADFWRDALITRAYTWSLAGLLLVVGIFATATAIAAWLVRRFSPDASGSGIPHVEAVLNDELPPAS